LERWPVRQVNPVGEWVTQQARNLSFDLAEQGRQAKFLIRDRDAKFTASFDGVFATKGIRVIATPIRSPRANAFAERFIGTVAERFIGTVRWECLDRLLVFHRAQLETVFSEFFDHYNEPVPFAAEKKPLRIGDPDPVQLRRRDKLGGLVHEYRLVA
jgi:putative transposase